MLSLLNLYIQMGLHILVYLKSTCPLSMLQWRTKQSSVGWLELEILFYSLILVKTYLQMYSWSVFVITSLSLVTIIWNKAVCRVFNLGVIKSIKCMTWIKIWSSILLFCKQDPHWEGLLQKINTIQWHFYFVMWQGV